MQIVDTRKHEVIVNSLQRHTAFYREMLSSCVLQALFAAVFFCCSILIMTIVTIDKFAVIISTRPPLPSPRSDYIKEESLKSEREHWKQLLNVSTLPPYSYKWKRDQVPPDIEYVSIAIGTRLIYREVFETFLTVGSTQANHE